MVQQLADNIGFLVGIMFFIWFLFFIPIFFFDWVTDLGL